MSHLNIFCWINRAPKGPILHLSILGLAQTDDGALMDFQFEIKLRYSSVKVTFKTISSVHLRIFRVISRLQNEFSKSLLTMLCVGPRTLDQGQIGT